MQISSHSSSPAVGAPAIQSSKALAANSTTTTDLNGSSQQENWPGCFRHVARCRRLNKEEVVLILTDPLKFGLVRTEVLPAEGISSGTVYLCSKDRVRVLKHDGIDYVKRNAAQGSNRIREDVVKMKVNGRHAVNSYSSRGSGSACFWRRRYALEPPAPTNSSVTGSRGRGQQTVTWGDQLVHYLDDEEARGFARRSPFGAAGVARSLTSEECWRGRGAQLPPDGNLFLPVSRRESSSTAAARLLEEQHHQAGHAHVQVALPSHASSVDKSLPSLSSSVVKKEDASPFRGGGGWGVSNGSSGSKTPPGSARRFCSGNEVRAVMPTVWGAAAEFYGMNGNGNNNMGDGGAGMSMAPSSGGRLSGGGGGGGGGAPSWEVRKSMETQQTAGLTNPTGFYDDDMGGLEFEGLGMSDVGQGTNGSNDDDMNDLFRSFLVDAEDLLAGTGGPAGSSHHSGGSGGNHSGASQSGGASVEHSAPAGFCLRVSDGGSAARGGGVGVRDAEGLAAVSRRTNASPQMDDMGGGGSGGSSQGLRLMDVPFRPISPQSLSQRSPMVMLPALMGSPPRRLESHVMNGNSSNNNNNSSSNNSNSNNNNNNSNNNKSGGGINSPASRFVPSNHGHGGHHGGGGHMGGMKVSAAAVVAVTAASGGGGGEAHGSPALQLASPWGGDNFASGSSINKSISPPCGLHDSGGIVMPAAPSPAGPLHDMSGGGEGSVAIVDFSPTWDFAPGGAKVLICLATPLDVDPGTAGPLVFFADRAVQSEVVTQTVLRCRVPPGPGHDGTGRVIIRVETSTSLGSHGSMGRLESPAASHNGCGGGGRNDGDMAGMHVFEYRSPVNSPSSATSNVSRGATPRVSTPGKKLSWQELPEDKSGATRKREWGEVTTRSAPSPLEPLVCNWVCNWADRGRGWGTPRAREPSAWAGGGSRGSGGRGPQSASGARRGQLHPWRRASGDFGQTVLSAARFADARSNEDSLGYPLLPCDGRECKIRIVERLGEIQGSRANSAADDTRCESGGRDSFGSSSSGGAAGGIASGIWAGGSNDSSAGANHSSELVLSRGEGSSLSVFGDGGIGARASVGGGQEYDLGHHHALDDTALNELGDAELEVLLEQMWMKVMGQLTDLESELNALDSQGFSVLHYTCLHSLSALVPVLLDRGADVNLRTGDGHDQTPLHLAAYAGDLEIVQELMKRGANMDAVDAHGLTPDKLADRCNKRKVSLYLWGQARGTAGATASSSTRNAGPNNITSSATASTPATTTMRQDSPAPVLPWGGGVSPVGCPPSPWSGSAGGADNWQGQLSPSPETPNEHMSSSNPNGNVSPPQSSTPQSHAGDIASVSIHGIAGGDGGGDPASPYLSQVGVGWNPVSTIRVAGGRSKASVDVLGGTGAPSGDLGSGQWRIGLPPPGGGRAAALRGVETDKDAPPSLERLEMVAMDEGRGGVGDGEGDRDGSTGGGSSYGKDASTEQFLLEAFSTLSLHEKCALSLHVSSLQQQGQPQDGGGGDANSSGIDYSEFSGVPGVLSGDEGGLHHNDLRQIMSMMGPSDLSDLEDEVKIIQQNVRAWILRCNYKSLRKAARTLQVAWRERQKNRFMEAPRLSTVGGASASPLSAHPPSPARSIPSLPSNLALNSHNGPEPMDDGSNDFMSGNNNSVAGDVSGGESPPRGSIANGSDADGGRGGRGGGGGGGGGGSVSLNLTGADGEQSTREERAAKALQTAARVMLARRGRFQRLARETSALLVIQKRSREWLNKK